MSHLRCTLLHFGPDREIGWSHKRLDTLIEFGFIKVKLWKLWQRDWEGRIEQTVFRHDV
jgi:hypothetical protein